VRRRPGDPREVRKDIEIVPSAVRVADSERVDAETEQIERTDGVVEVEPAELVGEIAVERLASSGSLVTLIFDGPLK
jgi:hypothetical protein